MNRLEQLKQKLALAQTDAERTTLRELIAKLEAREPTQPEPEQQPAASTGACSVCGDPAGPTRHMNAAQVAFWDAIASGRAKCIPYEGGRRE